MKCNNKGTERDSMFVQDEMTFSPLYFCLTLHYISHHLPHLDRVAPAVCKSVTTSDTLSPS